MIIVPVEKRFDWQHAPVMLIGIILINLLVFFFYQADDEAKLVGALDRYQETESLETEWPHFARFLETRGESDSLKECQQLYQDGNFGELSIWLLKSRPFHEQLMTDSVSIVGLDRATSWRNSRSDIFNQFHSASTLSWGLDAGDVKWYTLISSQFLHGDLMHLIGNMVFLMLCGFAVEAAIGHWRFLGFYLLSGVAGSLLYSVFNNTESSYLVGASGSISGVNG